MRGVVLDIKRKAGRISIFTDFGYYIRRWGIASGFILLTAVGLAAGCRLSLRFSDDVFNRLDFLFVTNLPERLDGGLWSAFAASFASDFIFLAAAFLLGLCPWGLPLIPVVAALKGFGVGVSAGYLIVSYGAGGLFFYLCVLVPGMLVYTAGLVYELCASAEIYKKLFAALFYDDGVCFREHFKIYLKKSSRSLIISIIAAAVDALLWISLAGAFGLN